MSARRWWWRAAAACLAFVGLEVLLVLLDSRPDPLRLALLVGTCTALLGLVADVVSDDDPEWSVKVDQPSLRSAGDSRLLRYVGLLEAHRSARGADRSVRDRLGRLADQVLRQRHGFGRDDPRAAELLGGELDDLITGEPRRITLAELDRGLSRIEDL